MKSELVLGLVLLCGLLVFGCNQPSTQQGLDLNYAGGEVANSLPFSCSGNAENWVTATTDVRLDANSVYNYNSEHSDAYVFSASNPPFQVASWLGIQSPKTSCATILKSTSRSYFNQDVPDSAIAFTVAHAHELPSGAIVEIENPNAPEALKVVHFVLAVDCCIDYSKLPNGVTLVGSSN